jgi:hypothetical protein
MGHKRPLKIGDKLGKRAAIGKQTGLEAEKIAKQLREKGVHVMKPLPYDQLAKLIQVCVCFQCVCLLIPCVHVCSIVFF